VDRWGDRGDRGDGRRARGAGAAHPAICREGRIDLNKTGTKDELKGGPDEIQIGSSSADIRLKGRFEIRAR